MTAARLAVLLFLIGAGASSAAADGLWLTNAELDAVLQDDGGDELTLPSADATARTAPRRWWPLALSAVLPGLGEITTGHMRGVPMMVADGAIWWFVYDKQQEGDDKEAEFEAFALENWSEEEWTIALADGELEPFFPRADPPYGPGTTPDKVPLYVSREVDEREWFENAGKWDEFAWGWREYWDDQWNLEMHPEFLGADFYAPQLNDRSTWFFGDNPTMTPLRRQYIEMRQESNDAYETRDTLLSAALLLRVFSVLQMVYLEGFVGRRYDANDEPELGLTTPQAGWQARAGVDGDGLVAWRMSW
jgi:hypothetical protein